MAKEKKEEFKDLPIKENPNYKQFRDTYIYLSRMGDAVKIFDSVERPCKLHMENGQIMFNVSINGVQKKTYLARAIYETFMGAIGKDERIMHINGIKTDNRLSNLKKMPIKDAMKYAHKYRGRKMIHDLNTNEVYKSAKECGKELGYTEDVIRRICNGTYRAKSDLRLRFVTEDEALMVGDKELKLYSIYKDGEFMVTGTKEECSKFMGWKAENTLWCYMCKSYKGLYKTNRIEVVEV